jgi:hypothetical protein
MIKIVNAALDERDNQIILRGVVDPDSLDKLLVADYQRERRENSSINQLANAIQNGRGVPDIQLGMRGGNYQDKNDAFYLSNDVYIIDGLQRATAALKLLAGGIEAKLGCTVYFNTNEQQERAMFKVLNMAQVKLSPNVLLRNEVTENNFLDMLYGLCKDPGFALKGRVCWDQTMKRSHLVSASSIVRTAAVLHNRFGGGNDGQHSLSAAKTMDKLQERMKRTVLRDNVKMYVNTIDELWGIRDIAYKERAPYIRQGFLLAMASVFSGHEDFWDDSKLVISGALKRKIGQFKITDPNVAQLAGSMGSAKDILQTMIVNHINSGKRTRRLTPLGSVPPSSDEEIA